MKEKSSIRKEIPNWKGADTEFRKSAEGDKAITYGERVEGPALFSSKRSKVSSPLVDETEVPGERPERVSTRQFIPKKHSRHAVVGKLLSVNGQKRYIKASVSGSYMEGNYKPLSKIYDKLLDKEFVKIQDGRNYGALSYREKLDAKKAALGKMWKICGGRDTGLHDYDMQRIIGLRGEKISDKEYHAERGNQVSKAAEWNYLKSALVGMRGKVFKPVVGFYIDDIEGLKRNMVKTVHAELRTRHSPKVARALTRRIVNRMFLNETDVYEFKGKRFDYDAVVRRFTKYSPDEFSSYRSDIHWFVRWDYLRKEYLKRSDESIFKNAQVKKLLNARKGNKNDILKMSMSLKDGLSNKRSPEERLLYAKELSGALKLIAGKKGSMFDRCRDFNKTGHDVASGKVGTLNYALLQSPRFFIDEYSAFEVANMTDGEVKQLKSMKNATGKAFRVWQIDGKMFRFKWKKQGHRWMRVMGSDVTDMALHINFATKGRVDLDSDKFEGVVECLHDGFNDNPIGLNGAYLVERIEVGNEHFHFIVTPNSKVSAREIAEDLKKKAKGFLMNNPKLPLVIEFQEGSSSISASHNTLKQLERYLDEHLEKDLLKVLKNPEELKKLTKRVSKNMRSVIAFGADEGGSEKKVDSKDRYEEDERTIHIRTKSHLVYEQRKLAGTNYCEKCGRGVFNSNNLAMHHKVGVAESRKQGVKVNVYQDTDNLRLLCKKCHLELHSKKVKSNAVNKDVWVMLGKGYPNKSENVYRTGDKKVDGD